MIPRAPTHDHKKRAVTRPDDSGARRGLRDGRRRGGRSGRRRAACTGSSVGHGQPPKPVRAVVGERLLDPGLGRSSRTGRTARPARRSGGPAARGPRRRRPPATIGTGVVGAQHRAGRRVERRRSPTRDARPRTRRACGPCRRRRAAAASSVAPGSDARCQIATSASGRDAHEFGGGGGRRRPASAPAMTVISVLRPVVVGGDVRAGCPRSHSIVKYGSTILSAAGRLSQIWNSSSGLGPLAVEQREHLAVDDAARPR